MRDVDGENGSHFSGLALAKCMKQLGRWRAGSEMQRKCLRATGQRQTFRYRSSPAACFGFLNRASSLCSPWGGGNGRLGLGLWEASGGPPLPVTRADDPDPCLGWTSRSYGSLSNASLPIRTRTPCQFLFTAVCAVLPMGPGTCLWDA